MSSQLALLCKIICTFVFVCAHTCAHTCHSEQGRVREQLVGVRFLSTVGSLRIQLKAVMLLLGTKNFCPLSLPGGPHLCITLVQGVVTIYVCEITSSIPVKRCEEEVPLRASELWQMKENWGPTDERLKTQMPPIQRGIQDWTQSQTQDNQRSPSYSRGCVPSGAWNWIWLHLPILCSSLATRMYDESFIPKEDSIKIKVRANRRVKTTGGLGDD